MPQITQDKLRVSVIRLLEAAAIGAIVLYGTQQVQGNQVATVQSAIQEHKNLGGHLPMESRMARQEARFESVDRRLIRIEEKIDQIGVVD